MRQSKLIAVAMGGASALNASWSLAKALRAMGHRVVYLTLAPHRERLERQNFPFYSFALPDDVETDGDAARGLTRYKRHVLKPLVTVEHISWCVEQWIAEHRPDLVLLDSNLFLFSVPFLKAGTPIINLNITFSSYYRDGRPPVFSGLLPPGSSALKALASEAAWLRLFAQQHLIETAYTAMLRMAGGAHVRTLAARVKLAGGTLKRSEYGLRLAAPEITLAPGCLDFPAPPNRRIRCYAGACVDEGRDDGPFDLSVVPAGKPLIYCAMGTCSVNYRHGRRLYRCLFEAMAQLPQYHLVLQTEDLGDVSDYGRVPANVHVFERTPQLELLERATVFITHGGASSTREGALYGVPMIVFPGWHDQPGNAARVVYHGLGLRARMKTITTPALVSMIRTVVDSDRMRSAAADMRRRILAMDELRQAARLVDDHLAGRHAYVA